MSPPVCSNFQSISDWLKKHHLKKKRRKKFDFGDNQSWLDSLVQKRQFEKALQFPSSSSSSPSTPSLFLPTQPVTLDFITSFGTSDTTVEFGWTPPASGPSNITYLYDIEALEIQGSTSRLSTNQANVPIVLATKFNKTTFSLASFLNVFEPSKSYQISIIPTNALGQRNTSLDLARTFLFGYPRLVSPVNIQRMANPPSSSLLAVEWEIPESISSLPNTPKGYAIQVAADAPTNSFLSWKNLKTASSSSTDTLENNSLCVLNSISFQNTLSLNQNLFVSPGVPIKYVRVAIVDANGFIGSYSTPLQIQTNQVLPALTSLTATWKPVTKSVEIRYTLEEEILPDIDQVLIEWEDPSELSLSLRRKVVSAVSMSASNPLTSVVDFVVPDTFEPGMQTLFYGTPRSKTNQVYGHTLLSQVFQRPFEVPEKVNFQVLQVDEQTILLRVDTQKTGGQPITSLEVICTPVALPMPAGTGQVPASVATASVVRSTLENLAVTSPGTSLLMNIVGVVPTRSYQIQVRAFNTIGPGSINSLVLQQKPPLRIAGPPSAPTNVVVTPANKGVQVQLSAPVYWGNVNTLDYDTSFAHRPDFVYVFKLESTSLMEPLLVSVESSAKTAVLQLPLENILQNGESYQLSVKARQKTAFTQPEFETVLQGPYESAFSPKSTAFVPFGVPYPPSFASIVSLDSSLVVNLLIDSVALSNGSALTEVEVSYNNRSFVRSVLWNEVVSVNDQPNVYRFLLDSLTNGQAYSLAFRLRNQAGYSEPLSTVEGGEPVVGGSPTGAPSFVRYVPRDKRLLVYLAPPPVPSTVSVDEFECQLATHVLFGPEDVIETVTQSTLGSLPVVFQSHLLQNETVYYFRVRTRNIVGTSPWSNPVQQLVPSAEPLVEPVLQAVTTGDSLSGVVLVVRVPPHSLYHPFTEAKVLFQPGTEVLLTIHPVIEAGSSGVELVRSLVFDNPELLIPGQTYDFQVQLINAAGSSLVSLPPQSASVGMYPRLVPFVQQKELDHVLEVELDPTFDFSLVENNGGYPIESIRVAVFDVTLGPNFTPVAFVDLLNLDLSVEENRVVRFSSSSMNGNKYVVFAITKTSFGSSSLTLDLFQQAPVLIPYGRPLAPFILDVQVLDLTPNLIEEVDTDIGFNILLQPPLSSNGRPLIGCHLYMERVKVVYDLQGQMTINSLDVNNPIVFNVPLEVDAEGALPDSFVIPYQFLMDREMFELGQDYRFWVESETIWGSSLPSAFTDPIRLTLTPTPVAVQDTLTQNFERTTTVPQINLTLQLETSNYLYVPALTGGSVITRFEALLYRYPTDPVSAFVAHLSTPVNVQSTTTGTFLNPNSLNDPTLDSTLVDFEFESTQFPFLYPGEIYYARIVSVNQSNLSSLSSIKGPFYVPLPGLPFQSVETRIQQEQEPRMFEVLVRMAQTSPPLPPPSVTNAIPYASSKVIAVPVSGSSSSANVELPILYGQDPLSFVLTFQSSFNPLDEQKLVVGETYRFYSTSSSFPTSGFELQSNPKLLWNQEILVILPPQAPQVSYQLQPDQSGLVVTVQRLYTKEQTGGSFITQYVFVLKSALHPDQVVSEVRIDESSLAAYEVSSQFTQTLFQVSSFPPLEGGYLLEVYALNEAYNQYGVKGDSFVTSTPIEVLPRTPLPPTIEVVSPLGLKESVTFTVDLSSTLLAKAELDSVSVFAENMDASEEDPFKTRLVRVLYVDEDWKEGDSEQKVTHTVSGLSDFVNYRLKAKCKHKNGVFSAFSDVSTLFVPGSTPLPVLDLRILSLLPEELTIRFQIDPGTIPSQALDYQIDLYEVHPVSLERRSILSSHTTSIVSGSSSLVDITLSPSNENPLFVLDASLFFQKLVTASITTKNSVLDFSTDPVFPKDTQSPYVKVLPKRPLSSEFPVIVPASLSTLTETGSMALVNQTWKQVRTEHYESLPGSHPFLTFGPSMYGGDVIGFLEYQGQVEYTFPVVEYTIKATSLVDNSVTSVPVGLPAPFFWSPANRFLCVKIDGLVPSHTYQLSVLLSFGDHMPQSNSNGPSVYFVSDEIALPGAFQPVGVAGIETRPSFNVQITEEAIPKIILGLAPGPLNNQVAYGTFNKQGDEQASLCLKIEKLDRDTRLLQEVQEFNEALPNQVSWDVTSFLNSAVYQPSTQFLRVYFVIRQASKKRISDAQGDRVMQAFLETFDAALDAPLVNANAVPLSVRVPLQPTDAFYQVNQELPLSWSFSTISASATNVMVQTRLHPLLHLFPKEVQQWLTNQGKTVEELTSELTFAVPNTDPFQLNHSFLFERLFEFGSYQAETSYSFSVPVSTYTDPTELFVFTFEDMKIEGPVSLFQTDLLKANPDPVSDLMVLPAQIETETPGFNLSFIPPEKGLVYQAFAGEMFSQTPRVNVFTYEIRLTLLNPALPESEQTVATELKSLSFQSSSLLSNQQHRQTVFFPFALPDQPNFLLKVDIRCINYEGLSSELVSWTSSASFVPVRPPALDIAFVQGSQVSEQEVFELILPEASSAQEQRSIKVIQQNGPEALNQVIFETLVPFDELVVRLEHSLLVDMRFDTAFDVVFRNKSSVNGSLSSETVYHCEPSVFQPLALTNVSQWQVDESKDQAVWTFDTASPSLREVLVYSSVSGGSGPISLVDREYVSLMRSVSGGSPWTVQIDHLRSLLGVNQTISFQVFFVYAGLVPYHSASLPNLNVFLNSITTPSSLLTQEVPVLARSSAATEYPVVTFPETRLVCYISNATPSELLVGPTTYAFYVNDVLLSSEDFFSHFLKSSQAQEMSAPGSGLEVVFRLDQMLQNGLIQTGIPFTLQAEASRLDSTSVRSNTVLATYSNEEIVPFQAVHAETFLFGQKKDHDLNAQPDVLDSTQLRVYLSLPQPLLEGGDASVFSFYKGSRIHLEYVLTSRDLVAKQSFSKMVDIPSSSSLSLEEFKQQYHPSPLQLSLQLEDAQHALFPDAQVYTIRARVETSLHVFSNWVERVYPVLFSIENRVSGDLLTLFWNPVSGAAHYVLSVVSLQNSESITIASRSNDTTYHTYLTSLNSFAGMPSAFRVASFDASNQLLNTYESRSFIYKPLALDTASFVCEEKEGVLFLSWLGNQVYDSVESYLASSYQWLIEYSVGVGSKNWSILKTLPSQRNQLHQYQIGTFQQGWVQDLPPQDFVAPYVYSFRVTPLDVFGSRGTASSVKVVQALTNIPPPVSLSFDINTQSFMVSFSPISTDSSLSSQVQYGVFVEQEPYASLNQENALSFSSSLSVSMSVDTVQNAFHRLGLVAGTPLRVKVAAFLDSRWGPALTTSSTSIPFLVPNPAVLSPIQMIEGVVLLHWQQDTTFEYVQVDCVRPLDQFKPSLVSSVVLNSADLIDRSNQRFLQDFFSQPGMGPLDTYEFRVSGFSAEGIRGPVSNTQTLTGFGYPSNLLFSVVSGRFLSFQWQTNPVMLQNQVEFLWFLQDNEHQWEPFLPDAENKISLATLLAHHMYRFKLIFRDLSTQFTSSLALSDIFYSNVPSPASLVQVVQEETQGTVHVTVDLSGPERLSKFVYLAQSEGSVSSIVSANLNNDLQAFLANPTPVFPLPSFIQKLSPPSDVLVTSVVASFVVPFVSSSETTYFFRAYVIDEEQRILQAGEPSEISYTPLGGLTPNNLQFYTSPRGDQVTFQWAGVAASTSTLSFTTSALTDIQADVVSSANQFTLPTSNVVSLFAPDTHHAIYAQGFRTDNGILQKGPRTVLTPTFLYHSTKQVTQVQVKEVQGDWTIFWNEQEEDPMSVYSAFAYDIFVEPLSGTGPRQFIQQVLQNNVIKAITLPAAVFEENLFQPGENYFIQVVPRESSTFQLALVEKTASVTYWTYPLPSQMTQDAQIVVEVDAPPSLRVSFENDIVYPSNQLPAGSTLLWNLTAEQTTPSQHLLVLEGVEPVVNQTTSQLEFKVANFSSIFTPGLSFTFGLQSYPSHVSSLAEASSLYRSYTTHPFRFDLLPAVDSGSVRVTNQTTDANGNDQIVVSFHQVNQASKYILYLNNQSEAFVEIPNASADPMTGVLSVPIPRVLALQNGDFSSFLLNIRTVDMYGIVGGETGFLPLYLMQMPTFVTIDPSSFSTNLATQTTSFLIDATFQGSAEGYTIDFYVLQPDTSYQKMSDWTQQVFQTTSPLVANLPSSNLTQGITFYMILTPFLGSVVGPSSSPPDLQNLSPNQVMVYNPPTLEASDLQVTQVDGMVQLSWVNPASSSNIGDVRFRAYVFLPLSQLWKVAGTTMDLSVQQLVFDPRLLPLNESSFSVRLYAFSYSTSGLSLNYLEVPNISYLGGFDQIQFALNCVKPSAALAETLDVDSIEREVELFVTGFGSVGQGGNSNLQLVVSFREAVSSVVPTHLSSPFTQITQPLWNGLQYTFSSTEWFGPGLFETEKVYDVQLHIQDSSNGSTGFPSVFRFFTPSLTLPNSSALIESSTVFINGRQLDFRLDALSLPLLLTPHPNMKNQFYRNLASSPSFDASTVKFDLQVRYEAPNGNEWQTVLVGNTFEDLIAYDLFNPSARSIRIGSVSTAQAPYLEALGLSFLGESHPTLYFRMFLSHPASGFVQVYSFTQQNQTGFLNWAVYSFQSNPLSVESFTYVRDPQDVYKVRLSVSGFSNFPVNSSVVLSQFSVNSTSSGNGFTNPPVYISDGSYEFSLYDPNSLLAFPQTSTDFFVQAIVEKNGSILVGVSDSKKSTLTLLSEPHPIYTPRFLSVVPFLDPVPPHTKLNVTFDSAAIPIYEVQLVGTNSSHYVFPASLTKTSSDSSLEDLRLSQTETLRVRLLTMDPSGFPYKYTPTPNQPESFYVFPAVQNVVPIDHPDGITQSMLDYYAFGLNFSGSTVRNQNASLYYDYFLTDFVTTHPLSADLSFIQAYNYAYLTLQCNMNHLPVDLIGILEISIYPNGSSASIDTISIRLPASEADRTSIFPGGVVYVPLPRAGGYFSNGETIIVVKVKPTDSNQAIYSYSETVSVAYTPPPFVNLKDHPEYISTAFVDPTNKNDLYLITKTTLPSVGLAFFSEDLVFNQNPTSYSSRVFRPYYQSGVRLATLNPLTALETSNLWFYASLQPDEHVFCVQNARTLIQQVTSSFWYTVNNWGVVALKVFPPNSIGMFPEPYSTDNFALVDFEDHMLIFPGDFILSYPFLTYTEPQPSNSFPGKMVNHKATTSFYSPVSQSTFWVSNANNVGVTFNSTWTLSAASGQTFTKVVTNQEFSSVQNVDTTWRLTPYLQPEDLDPDSYTVGEVAEIEAGQLINSFALTLDLEFRQVFATLPANTPLYRCTAIRFDTGPYQWSYDPPPTFPVATELRLFLSSNQNFQSTDTVPLNQTRDLLMEIVNASDYSQSGFLFYLNTGTEYNLTAYNNPALADGQKKVIVENVDQMLGQIINALTASPANVLIYLKKIMSVYESAYIVGEEEFLVKKNLFAWSQKNNQYQYLIQLLQPDALSLDNTSENERCEISFSPFTTANAFRAELFRSPAFERAYPELYQQTQAQSSTYQAAFFSYANLKSFLTAFPSASFRDLYLGVYPLTEYTQHPVLLKNGAVSYVNQSSSQELYRRFYIPGSAGLPDQVVFSFLQALISLTDATLVQNIQTQTQTLQLVFYSSELSSPAPLSAWSMRIYNKASGKGFADRSLENDFVDVTSQALSPLPLIQEGLEYTFTTEFGLDNYASNNYLQEVAIVPFYGIPHPAQQCRLKFSLNPTFNVSLTHSLANTVIPSQDILIQPNDAIAANLILDASKIFRFWITLETGETILVTSQPDRLTLTQAADSNFVVEGTSLEVNTNYIVYVQLYHPVVELNQAQTIFMSKELAFPLRIDLPDPTLPVITSAEVNYDGHLNVVLNLQDVNKFTLQLFFTSMDPNNQDKLYLVSSSGSGSVSIQSGQGFYEDLGVFSDPSNVTIQITDFIFSELLSLYPLIPFGENQIRLNAFLVSDKLVSTYNPSSVLITFPAIPASLSLTPSINKTSGVALLTFFIGPTKGAEYYNLFYRLVGSTPWLELGTPFVASETNTIQYVADISAFPFGTYEFTATSSSSLNGYQSDFYYTGYLNGNQTFLSYTWDALEQAPTSFTYTISSNDQEMETYLDFTLDVPANSTALFVDVYYEYTPLVSVYNTGGISFKENELSRTNAALESARTVAPVLLSNTANGVTATWSLAGSTSITRRFNFTQFEGYHGKYKFYAKVRNGFVESSSALLTCSTASNFNLFENGSFLWAADTIVGVSAKYLNGGQPSQRPVFNFSSLKFLSDIFLLPDGITQSPSFADFNVFRTKIRQPVYSVSSTLNISAPAPSTRVTIPYATGMTLTDESGQTVSGGTLPSSYFPGGRVFVSTFKLVDNVKHWSLRKTLFIPYSAENITFSPQASSLDINWTYPSDPSIPFYTDVNKSYFRVLNTSSNVSKDVPGLTTFFSPIPASGTLFSLRVFYFESAIPINYQNVYKMTMNFTDMGGSPFYGLLEGRGVSATYI